MQLYGCVSHYTSAGGFEASALSVAPCLCWCLDSNMAMIIQFSFGGFYWKAKVINGSHLFRFGKEVFHSASSPS